MRELFDIIPHSTGPGFRMGLKTGEIDVPDQSGGYIVSSGMGSGKTEASRALSVRNMMRVFSIAWIQGMSLRKCTGGYLRSLYL